MIFSLSQLSLFFITTISVLNGVMGIMISLIVVSVSANNEPTQYIAAFLPSYWIGKTVYQNTILYVPAFLIVAGIWMKV